MKLNILVLDDNLGAALYEIRKALALYLGTGASVQIPDFSVETSPAVPLELPAVGGKPAATIYFTANRSEVNIGELMAEEVTNGVFDSVQWDAVILDNNWAGAENENSGISRILPALLSSEAFKRSNPEYLLLTWHFKDPRYHRKVSEELEPYRSVANIKPIAKGTESDFSDWIGEMLKTRFAYKFGSGPPVGPPVPLRDQVNEVLAMDDEPHGNRTRVEEVDGGKKYRGEVRKDGSIWMNGKETAFTDTTNGWLRLLFFLIRYDVPIDKPGHLQAASQWLAQKVENMEKSSPEAPPNFGLPPSITQALKRLPRIPKDLMLCAGNPSKAMNHFRKDFECGPVLGGPGGDSPRTIRMSVEVIAFDMEAF